MPATAGELVGVGSTAALGCNSRETVEVPVIISVERLTIVAWRAQQGDLLPIALDPRRPTTAEPVMVDAPQV